MKFSLIIPTLGERPMELNRLLQSLQRQQFKDFEIIVVSQDNHETVSRILQEFPDIQSEHLTMDVKGLSKARNKGLKFVKGEIVILSDDDCWYPDNGLKIISDAFLSEPKIDVLLTQILDPDSGQLYKNYSDQPQWITSKLNLMSRSSIEIAFRIKEMTQPFFDELFGIGSIYACGEEVDFLLQNYKSNSIYYLPEITVFHKRKNKGSSEAQIVAKGAVYAKNYPAYISLAVLARDLLLKHENNFRTFFKGYYEYSKRKD